MADGTPAAPATPVITQDANATPAAPAPAAPAAPAPAAPAASGPDVITMTQAELNNKMAEHKRTLQKQLAEATQKANGFDALNQQVTELLGSGLISDVDSLADFREQAAQTIEAHRTESERLANEQKTIQKQLEEAQGAAQTAIKQYETATIDRGITDEAVGKADGPGALDLIKLKLAPLSKLDKDGNIVVTMPVADEDGKVAPKSLSVADAISAMEADVTRYGRLFKSTVNGGTGGEVVDGVNRTADGGIDFANISMEKYIELREKNPELIDNALKR